MHHYLDSYHPDNKMKCFKPQSHCLIYDAAVLSTVFYAIKGA